MKELNIVLEKALEKANQKKQKKSPVRDASHQIKVKEIELQNTKKTIEKYHKDITDMQKKLGKAQGVSKLIQLEEKLKDAQ